MSHDLTITRQIGRPHPRRWAECSTCGWRKGLKCTDSADDVMSEHALAVAEYIELNYRPRRLPAVPPGRGGAAEWGAGS